MRISVVIPAYNEGSSLERCLASLRNQIRQADEIIVVDNNSTDDTADIAVRYGARIVTERQQGIWPAAATGYDAARGQIIARIDADTVVPRDWLHKVAEHFADPKSIAVTGPGNFYGCTPVLRVTGDLLYMRPYFRLVGSALGHPPLFGSNFAMRKSAWLAARDHVNIRRTDIHDDIDLSYAIRKVDYRKDLAVAISARPLLAPPGDMASRFAKGLRSVLIHWPEEAPWAKRDTVPKVPHRQ